jgi:hypothetical protein
MIRGTVANGGVSLSIRSAMAATTSRYSGSPTAPGSLVRSSTAMERTVEGSAARKLVGRERLEQPHLEHSDLLAVRDERVDRLFDRADRRAHDDDDALRVGGAVVVDQPVAPAGALGQLVHDLLDDPGQGQVVRVRGLASLEEHVGVLRGAAHDRGVGREAAAAEREDVLIADEGPQVVVFEQDDLVDLVGGAEPVEEVEERHPRRSVAA